MSGNINAVIVIIILFSHNLTNEWSEQLTMQYIHMYSYKKMAVPSSMPQKFYCMLFKNNYTLKCQQQLRRRI